MPAKINNFLFCNGFFFRSKYNKCLNHFTEFFIRISHDSRFVPGGHPLIVHDRVTVGHQAVLHGCEVGEACLIGIGARVLDGAVLEPGVMLGAGALVPPGRLLEGGYLWVGVPARRLRALTAGEQDYLDYSADHYVHLAQRHRQ